MSQLLVGQPIANAGSTTAGVLPNHNGGESAAYTADNIGFSLTQPDTTAASTIAELETLPEMPVDASILPQLITALSRGAADTRLSADFPADAPLDKGATSGAEINAETLVQGEDVEYNVVTTELPEDTANSLLNPALLSAVNFLPQPSINSLRPESLQPSRVGLPGYSEADYSAKVLTPNKSYSISQSSPLPVTDTVLPTTTVSLQHFLRQTVEPLRQQSSDRTLPDMTPATTSTSNMTAATASPTFQWKSEQLGLQSSQWGQKLVHLLSDKVNLQLGQQIQRAQIRLDPPQLGLIELSVSVDGERTSVQLYASNSQMREAMQQNLEQLRQQLAQRLGNDQLLDIDVRQQSQQQSGQHHAGSEQIAGHFADETTHINSTPSAQSASGWLNRLV